MWVCVCEFEWCICTQSGHTFFIINQFNLTRYLYAVRLWLNKNSVCVFAFHWYAVRQYICVRARNSRTHSFSLPISHMFITDDDDGIQHFNWNESSILHENTNQAASRTVSIYRSLLSTFVVLLFCVFCLVSQQWKWWCDGNGSERVTSLSAAVAAAATCHWVCAFFDWLMVFGCRKTCYYKTS